MTAVDDVLNYDLSVLNVWPYDFFPTYLSWNIWYTLHNIF